MTDTTENLAVQQAALAAALVGNGSPPDGFDTQRIALASRMLVRKRAHAAVASWPAFAQLYGANIERDFAAYAQSHPLTPATTPKQDLLAFAKHLEDEEKLPPAVLRLLCVAESRYFLPNWRGEFICMRIPFLGVLTFRRPRR
jgi:hypothetical protein